MLAKKGEREGEKSKMDVKLHTCGHKLSEQVYGLGPPIKADTHKHIKRCMYSVYML